MLIVHRFQDTAAYSRTATHDVMLGILCCYITAITSSNSSLYARRFQKKTGRDYFRTQKREKSGKRAEMIRFDKNYIGYFDLSHVLDSVKPICCTP